MLTSGALNSLTCRQRKLKCDEEKPVCGQCRKGSRECQPSDGVVFRHQQNASMNGSGEVEDGSKKLAGFYACNQPISLSHTLSSLFCWLRGCLNLPARSQLSLPQRNILLIRWLDRNSFNEQNVWVDVPKRGMQISEGDGKGHTS